MHKYKTGGLQTILSIDQNAEGEMPIHIDDAFKGNWNSLLLVIRQKTIIGTGMILG